MDASSLIFLIVFFISDFFIVNDHVKYDNKVWVKFLFAKLYFQDKIKIHLFTAISRILITHLGKILGKMLIGPA